MAPAKRTAKKAATKTAKKTTAKKAAAKPAKKATAKKPAAKKAPEIPTFVYGSRIKDYVKSVSDSGAMRCPEETLAAINASIAEHVAAAVKRAEGNKRNTLRGMDF